MASAILALILGAVAAVAALRARRGLVAQLSQGQEGSYVWRFLLVQGGLNNVILWLVVRAAADWVALGDPLGGLALPLGYGALFFVYSLSNIDWTARKFHDVEP